MSTTTKQTLGYLVLATFRRYIAQWDSWQPDCSITEEEMETAIREEYGLADEIELDRIYWLQYRQSLLMDIDAVERYILHITPRTKELRDIVKGKKKP